MPLATKLQKNAAQPVRPQMIEYNTT